MKSDNNSRSTPQKPPYSPVLQQALALLEERNEIRRGTDRIKAALHFLGNPENDYPIIMVGGTNGKTSTSCFISQLLTKADYRVGLFTSPHPENILRTIRCRGIDISAKDLARLILRSSKMGIYLTTFELEVCAAYLYFAEKGVDIAVMEMGMGGKGDAVNVRPPDLAVITNISLEHTAYLGGTIEEIARNKGGIIPEGGVLVTAASPPALEVLRKIADTGEAEVFIPDYDSYLPFLAGLPAEYLKRNAALAIETVKRFIKNLGPENGDPRVICADIPEWAEMFSPPEARFQVIELNGNIRMILDGAHNPAGFSALFRELKTRMREWGDPRLVAVVGILKDKDIPAMAEITRGITGTFICTSPGGPRRERPEMIAMEFGKYHKKVEIEERVREAIGLGKEYLSPSGGVLLVTGSLYTVAEATKKK